MVGISMDNPGQNKAMVEEPGLPFPAEAMTKVYDRFLAAPAAHRHPVTTMALARGCLGVTEGSCIVLAGASSRR